MIRIYIRCTNSGTMTRVVYNLQKDYLIFNLFEFARNKFRKIVYVFMCLMLYVIILYRILFYLNISSYCSFHLSKMRYLFIILMPLDLLIYFTYIIN